MKSFKKFWLKNKNLSFSHVFPCCHKNIKAFKMLKMKKLSEKLKCISAKLSSQMLSTLPEYFLLFMLLNIFAKSLWFHKVFPFRWNYAHSLVENGSNKVFQSSLLRLKGYCTFASSTPWELYHAKERSGTEDCSSWDHNSAFHIPSLCLYLCMSPTWAAMVAVVGCMVDRRTPKAKLNSPVQSLFTSFIALVQLSYH